MEERNIKLSLDKAKEWYNSGNADLKEVALQAYSEEELKTEAWKYIKTFEDACDVLGLYKPLIAMDNVTVAFNIKYHLTALLKLDIIRQALNKDYKPSLGNGVVYYPWVRLYKSYEDAISEVEKEGYNLCGNVEVEGTTYYLVGGDSYGYGAGISLFDYRHQGVSADLGLFCCKSKKIAQHMSRYFAKEIFDAIYIQHYKH